MKADVHWYTGILVYMHQCDNVIVYILSLSKITCSTILSLAVEPCMNPLSRAPVSWRDPVRDLGSNITVFARGCQQQSDSLDSFYLLT